MLDFGDASYTVRGWPSVAIGAESWRFGDRGYRDALCALISQPVNAVEDSSDHGVVLTFALGHIATKAPARRGGRSRDRATRDLRPDVSAKPSRHLEGR